jgi:hypothetical protein
MSAHDSKNAVEPPSTQNHGEDQHIGKRDEDRDAENVSVEWAGAREERHNHEELENTEESADAQEPSKVEDEASDESEAQESSEVEDKHSSSSSSSSGYSPSGYGQNEGHPKSDNSSDNFACVEG